MAIGGLLALGSAVLLVAGTALVAAAWLSPAGFRAADTVESLYAVAVAPLLLVHIGGGIAIRRGHPWGKPLTTAACGFWILRFGYGLTLGALVLWLLWSPGTKGRGTSR